MREERLGSDIPMKCGGISPILEVLLGEVLQLRKHVQKLIKESEIDEPMLDTIHKTLKDLEEAMMLEM